MESISDAGSLSETILRVLDNHNGSIKEKAYVAANSAFGIDAMMGKTLSVYRMTLIASGLIACYWASGEA